MKAIIIDTPRDEYNPKEVRNTLTVAELIEILSDLDPEAKVVTSHDNGYTYGGIQYNSIEERDLDGDEDEY